MRGYTPPKGSLSVFGALLLAQRGADGWVYAGRVGGGFGEQTLETVAERLAKARAGAAPRDPEPAPGATWIEPEFVVEVKFKQRSEKGRLRQPTFVRLRDDKAPEDCWLPGEEKPLPESPVAKARAAPVVTVTHPD
jgi:bifunctional non-homologous end joining protein LigD